jgi:bifunctional non-homologous end joining protein LigD
VPDFGLAEREQVHLRAPRAILGGELVCLATDGRPDFYALLYRHAAPVFYAFDLLSIEGEDLREKPLEVRKRALRRLVPRQLAALRYVEHVVGRGVAFYRRRPRRAA